MVKVVLMAPLKRRSVLRVIVVGYALVALGIVLVALTGCEQETGKSIVQPAAGTTAMVVAQAAASCRDCHAEVHAAWSGTDHALANRKIDAARDAEALAKFHPPDASASVVAMILGHRPLWQPLIPTKGGRWQPHELAYDPVRQEWFNVFGEEHREAGEWGHWTGRGMNWNSQCAHCHMTGYQKNYDAATDTYHSTWSEQGVSCVQCHGTMPAGHGTNTPAQKPASGPFHGDRHLMMETCASCHARNELLTDTFQPGDRYADHYRVTLPVDPGLFWPDGQQRDEDFNWASMLLSRMGHAGVTCVDCHDSHTTKTILPVTNNQLCLQCHVAPGRVQPNGVRAVAIDPVAHSHHAAGSAGNSCVACHMPTATYMQRAPRHDHGWLKPDPLLTKELGIPNACATCHADQSVDWAIAQTNAWYGEKMESRQRVRARAVAAAQAGQPGAETMLLGLLPDEDIPAWRATLLSLLEPFSEQPAVIAVGQHSLTAADPLERAAAVRLLTGQPEQGARLWPLLKDPVRLVRLDAAWALSPELAEDSYERQELDAYLSLTLDQPAGRLRKGQDLANRGLLAAGEKEIALAEKWDPHSPRILETHAQVLIALGRPAEAGTKLRRAAMLTPDDSALAMRAGLAFAQAGRASDAEAALRLAVKRNPQFDRAWYNLGLLLSQTDRLGESAVALSQAERLAPSVADYPYALATVRLRAGERGAARAAAERTLLINPTHPGARQLLREIQ